MKIFLILVLIVVIMIIAKSVSDQIKDRYDFYYNLKQFLNNFKINLAFKQTKILDYLNQTNGKKEFKVFINSYKNFLRTSEVCLDDLKILDESEKKELADIINNTGKFDAKNEAFQIDSFLQTVQGKLNRAEQDKVKLCPMIIKLSFLFAIAVSVLLI